MKETSTHDFWKSPEGLKIKFRKIRAGKSRAAVSTPLRTKKSNKKADQAFIRERLLRQLSPWKIYWARKGIKLPRKRAGIALDFKFLSFARTTPRVDKICKWIIDELHGQGEESLLFYDDRQVKLLFALLIKVENRSDDSDLIYLTGQTFTNSISTIKMAASLDVPWNPIDFASQRSLGIYEFQFEGDYDGWRDYPRGIRPVGEELIRGKFANKLRLQYECLKQVDMSVSRLLVDFSTGYTKRVSNWDRENWLAWMMKSPYVFNFGPLPEMKGERTLFVSDIKNLVESRVEDNPHLYPIFLDLGVTLIYFESKKGKDLDNIFNEILPNILEIIRPIGSDVTHWSNIEEIVDVQSESNLKKNRGGNFSINFIEAISLPSPNTELYLPGTVIVCLARGDRDTSWWESAGDFLEEQYRKDFANDSIVD